MVKFNHFLKIQGVAIKEIKLFNLNGILLSQSKDNYSLNISFLNIRFYLIEFETYENEKDIQKRFNSLITPN